MMYYWFILFVLFDIFICNLIKINILLGLNGINVDFLIVLLIEFFKKG